MKTILLAIAFSAALCAQATTSVVDSLKDARARNVSGIIMIEWDAFLSGDGFQIGAGRAFVPVVNGQFSTSLIPTDHGSPIPRYYSVTYALKGGYRRNPELWSICTSATPINIASAIGGSCPQGGQVGPLSWHLLTSSQWATLTSSQWAALTN